LSLFWATRRVNACKRLGIEEVGYEIREYSDSLVIESNRYREKTWQEKLKEAEAIEKILKPEAEKNIRATQKNESSSAFQKSDKQINVLKETAATIGMSHDTLHKAKVIAQERPELLKQVDEGKRSIHSSYSEIMRKKSLRNGIFSD